VASIFKTLALDVPAARVWEALRDVGALHTRLVPGFVTDTRLEAGSRLVTFFNGRTVREWIVDIDESQRRVAWAIIDEPFRHYAANARVFEESDGRCRFEWRVDLLPDELASTVAGLMDRGLDAIRESQRPPQKNE
jgi:hypothetical protein